MPHCIKTYYKDWKQEFQKFSPQGWGFVSFVLPLVIVPLAVKGAQMAGKAIKKEIDKKKKQMSFMDKSDKKFIISTLIAAIVAPIVSVVTLQMIKKIGELKKR